MNHFQFDSSWLFSKFGNFCVRVPFKGSIARMQYKKRLSEIDILNAGRGTAKGQHSTKHARYDLFAYWTKT
jgi:hypothetical protein